MSTTTPARRGRPPVVDRDAVARAAIDLWSTQGFAATTWDQISERTGVSVRTLIRRFGSQPAILSRPIEAATERLRAALRAAPADADPSDVVHAAVVASVSEDDAVRSGGLPWVRVVAAEPLLQSWLRTAYAPWITELAASIRARVPDIDDDTAYALACGFEAVANAAMQAWARAGGTDSPAAHVAAAVHRIRID